MNDEFRDIHESTAFKRLHEYPIIAAIRDFSDIERVFHTPVRVVFLMGGDIQGITRTVRKLQDVGKTVFVHIDLCRGLAGDREGMLFLCNEAKPDGVVSTRINLLKVAKKLTVLTVQQLFVIDTQAFETGVRNIREFEPDAIEVMPGLMPRVIKELKKETEIPILAAGLIKSFAEVQLAIEAGATAVVAGAPELWDFTFE